VDNEQVEMQHWFIILYVQEALLILNLLSILIGQDFLDILYISWVSVRYIFFLLLIRIFLKVESGSTISIGFIHGTLRTIQIFRLLLVFFVGRIWSVVTNERLAKSRISSRLKNKNSIRPTPSWMKRRYRWDLPCFCCNFTVYFDLEST